VAVVSLLPGPHLPVREVGEVLRGAEGARLLHDDKGALTIDANYDGDANW
jgi:hypothetical protein